MSKNNKGCGYIALHGLCIIAFIIYIYCVMYITILSREPENKRINIDLLYSYKELFQNKNYFYFNMIFLNIAMLVPFGIMFPLIFKKSDNAFKVFLSGFLFSLCIEITQYITGRGLFELDDLLNNTIGAVIGYIVLTIIRKMIPDNSDKGHIKT